MEREKRLELLRILLQAVKLQVDYLCAYPADVQLTAQGEANPTDLGTVHEADSCPPALKGGQESDLEGGITPEVVSGSPEGNVTL